MNRRDMNVPLHAMSKPALVEKCQDLSDELERVRGSLTDTMDRNSDLRYRNTKLVRVQWPDSKHNQSPSMAVDVAPYPIDWADRERFNYFAGYVMGVASQHGIALRWGGDWNRDWKVRDNNFDDLPHYELIVPKE
jgi:hypothetical protein